MAKRLLVLRWFLTFGVVELTLLSNLLPAKVLVAALAWLCLLLLIVVYLFDVIYHSVGRKS